LELEDHNFKVNSDGWKKITVDDVEYLENPEGDIWEILENEARGEQLFTWKSAMRETEKAGKRMPTDSEFTELLKTKEDMPNLVFPATAVLMALSTLRARARTRTFGRLPCLGLLLGYASCSLVTPLSTAPRTVRRTAFRFVVLKTKE